MRSTCRGAPSGSSGMTSERAAIGFEIVTLFPEFFDDILGASLLGKAIAAGLIDVHRTNLRDFGIGRHRSVDDTPYGGGPGMILRVEPIAAALDAIAAARGPSRRVLLSPQGARLDQRKVVELAASPRITLDLWALRRVRRADHAPGRRAAEHRRLRPRGRRAGGGGGHRGGGAAGARRAGVRDVGERRIVLARAPGISAVDPAARLERRRRAAGADLGRSWRDRALAAPRSAAANGRAAPRSPGRPSAGRRRSAPDGRAGPGARPGTRPGKRDDRGDDPKD